MEVLKYPLLLDAQANLLGRLVLIVVQVGQVHLALGQPATSLLRSTTSGSDH